MNSTAYGNIQPVESIPLGQQDHSVKKLEPLISPCCLIEQIPLSATVAELIRDARRECHQIIHGHDDRLLCVVGPGSIHDVKAVKEYAMRLRKLQLKYSDDLYILIRLRFEKSVNSRWQGLINDPDLDGSFKVNKGLSLARKLLLEMNELGLPCGCEFRDTMSPQWLADFVSWGSVGAETTESQIHRELASGLSMPVGFKNSTSGNFQLASNSLRSAARPHAFLSVTKQGLAAIVHTKGNPDVHVVLRGGRAGPNYDATNVLLATTALKKDKANRRIIIECAHIGCSSEDVFSQSVVARDVARQIAGGNTDIIGIMCESNIVAGKQDYIVGKTPKERLKYGKSICEDCIDLATTDELLAELAAAVCRRREAGKSKL